MNNKILLLTCFVCTLGAMERKSPDLSVAKDKKTTCDTHCNTKFLLAARPSSTSSCDEIPPRQSAISDLNKVDQYDETPLMQAVFSDDVVAVQDLLDLNVNVNRQNSKGQTALMAAVIIGNRDMVNLLIARGAHVNVVNDEGNTVLAIATIHGDCELAKILIENGAIIDQQNFNGETALKIAVLNNTRELVKTLLDYGANPDTQDCSGQTPLEAAAFKGYQDIVKLLLLYSGRTSISAVTICSAYTTAKTQLEKTGDRRFYAIFSILKKYVRPQLVIQSQYVSAPLRAHSESPAIREIPSDTNASVTPTVGQSPELTMHHGALQASKFSMPEQKATSKYQSLAQLAKKGVEFIPK